jgi:hypothetical protein
MRGVRGEYDKFFSYGENARHLAGDGEVEGMLELALVGAGGGRGGIRMEDVQPSPSPVTRRTTAEFEEGGEEHHRNGAENAPGGWGALWVGEPASIAMGRLVYRRQQTEVGRSRIVHL